MICLASQLAFWYRSLSFARLPSITFSSLGYRFRVVLNALVLKPSFVVSFAFSVVSMIGLSWRRLTAWMRIAEKLLRVVVPLGTFFTACSACIATLPCLLSRPIHTLELEPAGLAILGRR